MKICLLILVLIISHLTFISYAENNMEKKVTVVFNEKISCQEANEILIPNDFVVDCPEKDEKVYAYNAHYLAESLTQKVLGKTKKSNKKIKVIQLKRVLLYNKE